MLRRAVRQRYQEGTRKVVDQESGLMSAREDKTVALMKNDRRRGPVTSAHSNRGYPTKFVKVGR